METQIKLKPWGKEIWFAHNNRYAGKILEIKKGHRYSLQYHKIKEETQYVLKGQIKMTYGSDANNLKEIILKQGDKLDIAPGRFIERKALKTARYWRSQLRNWMT